MDLMSGEIPRNGGIKMGMYRVYVDGTITDRDGDEVPYQDDRGEYDVNDGKYILVKADSKESASAKIISWALKKKLVITELKIESYSPPKLLNL
jgi:hypothetical protein